MKPTISLMAAILLISGSLPVFGQSGQKSTGAVTNQSNILQQYDEAIGQVAEKAIVGFPLLNRKSLFCCKWLPLTSRNPNDEATTSNRTCGVTPPKLSIAPSQ
jgi:hypothetical protein